MIECLHQTQMIPPNGLFWNLCGQGWVPSKADSKMEIRGDGVYPDVPLGSTPVAGGEGSRLGRRWAATQAQQPPWWTPGAGMTLWGSCELVWYGQALTLPHRSVPGCGSPEKGCDRGRGSYEQLRPPLKGLPDGGVCWQHSCSWRAASSSVKEGLGSAVQRPLTLGNSR